ncbi:hypothetical protein ACFXJ8_36715 [Nonomuraea sp. NPDC059194]|uniref:hypothetical protein n=1 Tax=Nonomuraea sp. NPDC059194 TaxID=3346764 RepID=UPI0036B728E1
MSELETLLSDSLSRAAGRAPAAPHDLLQRVAAARRRRRRGTAAAGAAAVALVTMAGFLVTTSISDGAPREAAASSTGLGQARPLKKVWPGAVHTIPLTLPNGRPYHTERFLDPDTLLVRTLKGGHADRSDGLWAYNVKTRAASRLVAVKTPKGTVGSWSFTAMGEGQLVWWTLRRDGDRRVVDIWAAPVKGGAQREVTSFHGAPGRAEIDAFEVADGKVVWSLGRDGGVYEARLAGGASKKIAGTEGLHLMRWPWAAAFQFPRKKHFDRPPYGELVNVLTGERRAAPATQSQQAQSEQAQSQQAQSQQPWDCGITWCVSGDKARTRDGSRERDLPGYPFGNLPAMDRFLVVTKMDGARFKGMVLYDLETGKSGDLGIKRNRDGSFSSPTLDHRAPAMFAYELGDKMVVVDLAVAAH